MKKRQPIQIGHHPLLRAFTLIELLVVVAIVAGLATLLSPSLKLVMESGRSTVCKSNLKQIALGLHGYAADHNGKTPPYRETASDSAAVKSADGAEHSARERFWLYTSPIMAGSYQGGARGRDGFLGPYMGREEGTQSSVVGCPSLGASTGVSTWAGVAYETQFYFEASLGLNLDVTGLKSDGKNGLGRYVAEIADPVDYIVFCDTLGIYGAYVIPGLHPPEDFTRHTPTERHADRFNALHLDGHVENAAHETHYNPAHFIRVLPDS
jgi:prepilin-type N-terminal cleavage/methylation domain-containing protein/prepilin-type processing-associated H-X9-DG protein